MNCPYCGSSKHHVTNTYNGDMVKRLRKCYTCNRKFHTLEVVYVEKEAINGKASNSGRDT